MERLMTESLAEALATRTTEKVREVFNASWNTVLNEFVSTRKSNEALTNKLNVLTEKLGEQNQNLVEALAKLNATLNSIREQQRQASQILKKATEEMGLSE